MNQKFYRTGVTQISSAAFLLGLNPIIVKFSSLDSYSLAVGRVLGAAVFLLGSLFISQFTQRSTVKKNELDGKAPALNHPYNPLNQTHRSETRRKPIEVAGIIRALKKDWLQFILFGLFHGLTIVLFFLSVKLINTAVASILLYAGSIYLALFSYIFLKESIEPRTIAAIFISTIGIIALFWTSEFKTNFGGYGVGFLSGVSMALVYLFGKILSRHHDRLTMAAMQNIFALPLIFPIMLFSTFTLSPANILTLIFLGIICTAIPFLLIFEGIKRVPGQKLGVLLMLEPLTPIILSFILLQEFPNLTEGIGGLLVFIGYLTIVLR